MSPRVRDTVREIADQFRIGDICARANMSDSETKEGADDYCKRFGVCGYVRYFRVYFRCQFDYIVSRRAALCDFDCLVLA